MRKGKEREIPLRVDVPFDKQEKEAFEKFLFNTGRLRGTYVRFLILEAMKREQEVAV